MNCQILFSGKDKKKNTNLSSAELPQRVVKVNTYIGKTSYDPMYRELMCSEFFLQQPVVCSQLFKYLKGCIFSI